MPSHRTNSTNKYWISPALYNELREYVDGMLSRLLNTDPKRVGDLQSQLVKAQAAQEVLNFISNKVPTEELPNGINSRRGQQGPGCPLSGGAAAGTPEDQEVREGGDQESIPEGSTATGDTEPAESRTRGPRQDDNGG